MIIQRDQEIIQKNQELDQLILDKNHKIIQRDQELVELRSTVERLNELIKQKNTQVQSTIERLTELLNQKDEVIQLKNEENDQLMRSCLDKDKKISILSRKLEAQEAENLTLKQNEVKLGVVFRSYAEKINRLKQNQCEKSDSQEAGVRVVE